MGLFTTGDYDSPTVRRGVDYLVHRQRADGTWDDEHWTGTGFPKVFYLKYHLYAHYFPLQALGLYEEHMSAACAPPAEIVERREQAA
jgi:squalene-hopene/tetraprenyl-beta-curcumene cyclase